jgi:hypothetical protein
LPKPSIHDTNLVDAQLVITRGADGRHRIGQITYKSEEDILNQQPACPHHHHNQHQSPPRKMKTARSTEQLTPLSIFNKQSSPSTDQDYSSLTETPTHSKPSSSSSLDFKEESIEQPMESLDLTTTEDHPIRFYSPVNKSKTEPVVQVDDHPIESTKPSDQKFKDNKSRITESVIGNIDDDIHSTSTAVEHDFDINDIEDVMRITKKSTPNENTTNMDNDSLEDSEGVLEEKKKPSLPPTSTKKSSGYTSAFYIAQKQKFQQEQITNRKRPPISNLNRYSSRSTTLSNVVEGIKKDEQISKQRRKPMVVTQRSQSSDLIEKSNDISKLDRDSGFDEQDFRRERLHSNGDENSSVSSMKSPRSSIVARSVNLEIRENKAYELRMKKLDTKRNSLEKDPPLKTRQNSSLSTRRGSDLVPPIPPTNKYRKSSQPIVNIKQQQQQQQNKKTNP